MRLTLATSARVFLSDLMQGLLAVSHNSLAVFGLIVLSTLVVLGGRADLRGTLEDTALDWLLARQESRYTADAGADDADSADAFAIDRATAADPSRLNRQQAAVAQWLSRRYRVAPEPVSALVQEAWAAGKRTKLEPTLILAIMAIESSFNPFAQSPVGAQGLMQVMTTVHDAKYEPFGGTHAAFDPVTNLRVGVEVLQECISRAGGSLEGGLRLYVGAGNLAADGGYATRVFAEERFLRDIAQGRSVPVTAKLPTPDGNAVTPAVATNTTQVSAATSATRLPASPSPSSAAAAATKTSVALPAGAAIAQQPFVPVVAPAVLSPVAAPVLAASHPAPALDKPPAKDAAPSSDKSDQIALLR
jgi:hypothetical protein